MAQRRFGEPQFESSRHETWCFGIIHHIHKQARQLEATGVINSLGFHEIRVEHEDHFNLSEFRSLKPDLYKILFSAIVFDVRKLLASISKPCERYTFKTRFLENIFLRILNENGLLTDSTKYYYESVLDIFPNTTFGLAFFIDFLSDQGWYKYGSKILAHLPDENQIQIILNWLNEFSSDVQLTTLKVTWWIEKCLVEYNDYDVYLRFSKEADQFKKQSAAKTYNFKENLTMYLAILNVYLEAVFEHIARVAARERGADKKFDSNACPLEDHQSEVRISSLPISPISNLIRELEEILFPGREYDNNEIVHGCFENPENYTIRDMITYISGSYEFLKVVADEVKVLQMDKLKYEVFLAIKSVWRSWKSKKDTFNRSSDWTILSLKRFFSQDCGESRFLTIAFINNGVPMYLDILEVLPGDIYVNAYVLHALGLAIGKTEHIYHTHKLTCILQKVLGSVRPYKNVAPLFENRLALYGLYNYGEPTQDKLNLFINLSRPGCIEFRYARFPILAGAYIYPCEFIEGVFADILEHRHSMLGSLCDLFCTELSPVCSSVVDIRFNNTFIECLINNRLTTPPTEATVQGLLKIIQDIYSFYYNNKNPILPKILTLERLMLCLTWEGTCDPLGSVEAKLSIYKLIKKLSDAERIPWDLVKKEPKYIIYNLVQYIDSFFNQPRRRGEIISLIEFIMETKVCRKLTHDEFSYMIERAEHFVEEKALFGVLDSYVEGSLGKFYTKVYLGNYIMIAAFVTDNVWLRYSYNPVEDNKTLTDLITVHMQFFSRREYDNLFYFLCHFLKIDSVIAQFVSSYLLQSDGTTLDVEFESNCLCDCIEFHCENYFKNPKLYECKKGPRYRNKRFSRGELLPLVFYQVDRMFTFFPTNANSEADKQRIDRLLLKLAKEMKEIDIDAAEAFFPEGRPRHCCITGRGKEILERFFGELHWRPKPYKEPILIPAGYNYR